jgi:hypothetical protein
MCAFSKKVRSSSVRVALGLSVAFRFNVALVCSDSVDIKSAISIVCGADLGRYRSAQRRALPVNVRQLCRCVI